MFCHITTAHSLLVLVIKFLVIGGIHPNFYNETVPINRRDLGSNATVRIFPIQLARDVKTMTLVYPIHVKLANALLKQIQMGCSVSYVIALQEKSLLTVMIRATLILVIRGVNKNLMFHFFLWILLIEFVLSSLSHSLIAPSPRNYSPPSGCNYHAWWAIYYLTTKLY